MDPDPWSSRSRRAFEGQEHAVSSEMLYPPMSVALFVSRGDAIPSPITDEIVAFVKAGLEYAGFTVEIQ
jgi:hypothetical protein